MRVVGKVLLPATSHTDYDVSGWMTKPGLERAIGAGDDGIEDYLLVRWAPGTDVQAASTRLVKLGGQDLFSQPAVIPTAVVDLGRLTDLPLVLGVFFALLACATVAHALVTTARRRRHDFAVLRSIGFTRRQSRIAIAWQATMLTVIGVLIGVPLGIAVGRLTWRWLADDYPILYVPPLALAADPARGAGCAAARERARPRGRPARWRRSVPRRPCASSELRGRTIAGGGRVECEGAGQNWGRVPVLRVPVMAVPMPFLIAASGV